MVFVQDVFMFLPPIFRDRGPHRSAAALAWRWGSSAKSCALVSILVFVSLFVWVGLKKPWYALLIIYALRAYTLMFLILPEC